MVPPSNVQHISSLCHFLEDFSVSNDNYIFTKNNKCFVNYHYKLHGKSLITRNIIKSYDRICYSRNNQIYWTGNKQSTVQSDVIQHTFSKYYFYELHGPSKPKHRERDTEVRYNGHNERISGSFI